MQRLSASLLVMAMLFTSLPCIAQEPIPFNALARAAAVQPSLSDLSAMPDGQSNPSAQPVKHSHWTKGGKIMTFIGIPVMAAGGAMFAIGMNGNSTSCAGACTSVDWKWTGAAWLGVGGVLTAIGTTRRSE